MRTRAAVRKRASDHKGVYRCGRKWKSQIQCNGVQYYLGVFSTEEEAVQEYTKAATRLGKLTTIPGVETDVKDVDEKEAKPVLVSIPHRELNLLLKKLELGKVTVELSEYQLLTATNPTDINYRDCIVELSKKREELLESILKDHSLKATENYDV